MTILGLRIKITLNKFAERGEGQAVFRPCQVIVKFTDQGYIVNLRRHGESSLILTVLTKSHGKVTGYVKNALTKKKLGIFQLGNFIEISAYSRVDDNMLSLKTELIAPTAVNFLSDNAKLQALSSLCALSNTCMPELQDLERFYYYIDSFFNLIDEDNWLAHYSFFEFYLLEYLGISLDLSECSATGSTENLLYVSPKTGKAVCAEAGEPYKDRLYKYPRYILECNYRPKAEELADLLSMTEFFLYKNFFAAHGLKFPESRVNLSQIIRYNSTKS